MNFLNYIFRSLHLLSVVVWLGGLIFYSGVINLIVKQFSNDAHTVTRKLNHWFIRIGWICILTILLSGLILMLGNKWDERQLFILVSKQLVFVIILLLTYGSAKMIRYLDSPSSNGGFNEKAEIYRMRVNQFRKINIYLGITAILLSAALKLNV